MAGLDLSSLSPRDAVVALRSYPRRFRRLFATLSDDEDPEDLVHRPGPDGRSALDHASHVARTLGLIEQALGRVVTADEPVLHAGVLDDSQREWSGPHDQEMAAALDHLELEAEQLASAIERVSSGDWGRAAGIAGGGRTTALDVVKEAVRTGSDHLRAAEKALAHARRR